MSWNHNQPWLGRAIWYFLGQKSEGPVHFLARSGPSLSGNLSLTNICYRMWMQQLASLVCTMLFKPIYQRQTLNFTAGSGSVDDMSQCKVGRWFKRPLPRWSRPSQNSLVVFACENSNSTLRNEADLSVIASSQTGLCDGLFDKREI